MPGIMSTKSREVIYGGRIIGAKIRAEDARQHAADAAREIKPYRWTHPDDDDRR